MNRTEYYNLGLPEGADVFNPLSPFNENMEAIADQMHTNEIKTIGQATELKSDTVHAITRVTPDSTFFSFTATSDYNAGDVFTVDGIQVTAKTPTGESLGTGAYVINSQVLCVLVGTLMTVFTSTGKVALASDSERLGGELPDHYGTAQDVETAVQTAQNANTISLANQQSIIELQTNINKIFIDVDNPIIETDPANAGNFTYTATQSCYVIFVFYGNGNGGAGIAINGVEIANTTEQSGVTRPTLGTYLKQGQTFSTTRANNNGRFKAFPLIN